jgi:hypothetical protein
LARHGKITPALIRREPDVACFHTFKSRLGGMLNAYRLAGYEAPWRNWKADREHPYYALSRRSIERLCILLDEAGIPAAPHAKRARLTLEDGRWISVEVVKQYILRGDGRGGG